MDSPTSGVWVDPKHCTHVNPDTGLQCKGYRLGGHQFCYFHEPSVAEQRKMAQRIGGKRKHERQAKAAETPVSTDKNELILPKDIMDEEIPEDDVIEVTSTDDLMPLMNRVLTLAFVGRANPQLINSITNAIKAANHILETKVLEDRIKELEEQYGVQK